MNILMVTADHLMIDRRILQEAKTLIANGHNVTLLAGFECKERVSYVQDSIKIERFVFDWSDSRFAPIVKKLKLKSGSHISNFAWRVWRYLAAAADFSSFDRFILDRLLEYPVDILHVHDFPMLRAGVALARYRNVPLVYDAHELYYAQTQLPASTQRKYMRREKKWIKYADHVITVNPYIAKLMSDRYDITSPTVLMNAAPLQRTTSDNPLRRRFNLDSNHRILLYQGWISDNRGIDRLVLAAKYFDPGIVLVIVGYGAYEKSLRNLVEQHSLSDRVFFFGGVDSEDLHVLTCDADLGVIPYYGVDENNFYCSPNKLFEFAIAELPFVSNDLPFLKDISNLYKNGIQADLDNPESLAKVVNSILSDPVVYARLCEGAKIAKDSINWEIEEQKLLSVYKSLE